MSEDRVRIVRSFFRKVTDNNYGSMDIGCTVDTLVGTEETQEEASERAFRFCRRSVLKDLKKIRGEE